MAKFLKKFLPSIIAGAVLTLLVLLSLDSFSNPEKTKKILGFSAYLLIIPFLFSQLILRVKFKKFFDKRLIKPLFFFEIFLILLIFGLSIFWANSHANAVFELTRLHPQGLTLIAFFTAFSLLINQEDVWWQRHWQKVVLIFPAGIFMLLYPVSLWPFNIFKEIVKEDRIIEYAQFFVLFVGGVLSSINLVYFFKKKKWWIAVFYFMTMVGFFLIAGDEISWGQRLLGLETSEQFKEVNRQGELTFHNLYIFEWLVGYAYVAISFFGVFAHFITKLIKPLNKYTYLVPSKILVIYFLFSLVYFVQQVRIMWGIWHSWSEVAELSLYTGIVLWVILINKMEKTNILKEKKK